MHSHKPSEKSMAQFLAQVQAQEKRLHAERAEGVPALQMRTTAPDLLIVVSEHPLDFPRPADMVLHLNRGDAGKVEQLAAQVWARESRKEQTS